MSAERFDIDVSYRDPWDRDDSIAEPGPRPAEYEDPVEPFECPTCGSTERSHPEDRCPECPA